MFAAGEIVPGLAAADAVQNGTVEMCHTASYYYFGKDPTFAFGTAVPFGLNTRMQNAWMFFGGGDGPDERLLQEVQHLRASRPAIPAHRWAAGSAKRSRTSADLNGLKMRIGGFAGTVLQKLGAVPQQIAGGDIYPALEKGTIDAAEWVGPYDDEKLGFYKVAKYYYYPGWWEGSAMLHNFINIDKWNGLPPSYKSIVRSASALANEWMLAKYDAGNPARFEAVGCWRRASCGRSTSRSSRPATRHQTRFTRTTSAKNAGVQEGV